jgi:hypothetical protein
MSVKRCAVALMIVLLLAAFTHSQIRGKASQATWNPLAQPLIFVQIPSASASQTCLGERGRIAVRDAHGKITLLTPSFHSAADPDISFDGERILFAGKKNATDRWAIYEMKSDGSGLRQVTRVEGDCRQPGYQSLLNTLVADRPWYQITFVSDVAGELNEDGSGPSMSLYSCKPDGTLVNRLTFNPSSNVDPFLHQDGRLIFSSWQRRSLDRGLGGRIALFGINLDGTDLALFSGDEGRSIKYMPCVTDHGLAVFVEPFKPVWDRSGGLSMVTIRRPLHSYRAITREEDGLFHSPSPLPEGTVVVSRRPADGSGSHGLYRMDPATGRRSLIFDDPAHHEIQAKLLAPRPEPDGRSTSVFVPTGDIDDPTTASYAPRNPMGKLYCLNAHISDLDPKIWIPEGTIRRVRVLEGIPNRPGNREPAGIPPLLQRRILGEAPVDEDGSFNLQVPADIPIELQVLDGDGLALRSCGWIWVKNNEPRGCIGCHEDGELAPQNRLASALKRPSVQLTLPSERRRSVDFMRDLMPIIESKCASCHRGTQPLALEGAIPAALQAFSAASARLLAAKEGSGPLPLSGKYVEAGCARTSPLIWHLFGRNMSRPWDRTAITAASRVELMPPPGSPPLSVDEKRVFIEWIDTAAHWKGFAASATAVKGTVSRDGGKR